MEYNLFEKASEMNKMNKSTCNKKKNKGRNVFYFFAVAAVAAAAVVVTIKEGNRIKKENELLSYEVW